MQQPAATHDLTAARMAVLSSAVAMPAELPQRIRILQWGENIGRTTKSRIVVGQVTLSMLPSYQEATASERIGIDFEHQSVPKHPNYRPDPRDMVGHCRVEVVEGDGVYLNAIAYTPAGRRFAANYPDVSAHVFLDEAGNLLLVRSVALTQHGDVCGMEFSEAVAACALCPDISLSADPTPTPTENNTMDTNTPDPEMPDYRAMLITLLGLSPADGATEVTDEEIGAAIARKADAAEADPPPPAAEASLSGRMDAFERRQILFEARHAGKVIPLSDEVLATMPTATLSALVAGLPAGEVPTARPGSATADRPDPASREVALSAEQAAAAKALGLSAEDYRAALT